MRSISLLENTAFYSFLFHQIKSAKKSILIAAFSFNLHEARDSQRHVRNLIRLLIQKHQAGVSVRILLGTPYRFRSTDPFKPLDTANELVFTILHAFGVPVAYFSPPKQRTSSHSKYIVLDKRMTLLGSHNLSPRSFSVGNDDSVAISDPAVATLITRRFQADWSKRDQPPRKEIVPFDQSRFHLHPATPPLVKVPKANVATAVEVLFEQAYFVSLLAAIGSALASLDISMFYFSTARADTAITTRLLHSIVDAHRRGVVVRVILDRDKPGDVYLSEETNKKRFKALKDAGISVVYDVPETANHSKLVIIDGNQVFIGSHNWTEGSYSSYQDLSVSITSAEIGRKYTGLFNARFKKLSVAAPRPRA